MSGKEMTKREKDLKAHFGQLLNFVQSRHSFGDDLHDADFKEQANIYSYRSDENMLSSLYKKMFPDDTASPGYIHDYAKAMSRLPNEVITDIIKWNVITKKTHDAMKKEPLTGKNAFVFMMETLKQTNVEPAEVMGLMKDVVGIPAMTLAANHKDELLKLRNFSTLYNELCAGEDRIMTDDFNYYDVSPNIIEYRSAQLFLSSMKRDVDKIAEKICTDNNISDIEYDTIYSTAQKCDEKRFRDEVTQLFDEKLDNYQLNLESDYGYGNNPAKGLSGWIRFFPELAARLPQHTHEEVQRFFEEKTRFEMRGDVEFAEAFDKKLVKETRVYRVDHCFNYCKKDEKVCSYAKKLMDEMLKDYTPSEKIKSGDVSGLVANFPELADKIPTFSIHDVLRQDMEDAVYRQKRMDTVYSALRINGRTNIDSRLARDIALETDLSKPEHIRRMVDLFETLNFRPEVYGSEYNTFYPSKSTSVLARLDVEEWMYPVLQKVPEKILGDRPGNPVRLFDACKAWKMNPLIWKNEAVKIGKMPMMARIVAAAIVAKMAEEEKVNLKTLWENRWCNDKSLRAGFWQKMGEAQKMGWDKALLLYAEDNEKNKRRILNSDVPFLDETVTHAIINNSTLQQVVQNIPFLKKVKYSSVHEQRYFFEKYGMGKLKEYSFSAQQRVMNVLVAELGKENKLPPEALKNFRKSNNAEVEKMFIYSNNAEVEKMFIYNGDWLVPASFKAADVFGCWFPNYLKKTQKAGLSTHDAVYWLPEDMGKAKNESFSQFIRNNILYPTNDGKEHARPLRELDVIARNWKTLTPEQEKMRYKDVLAVCMSRKYDNQKYDNFAVEAAKFGYKEEDYHNMEQIYQAGLSVPEPFDSSKRFEFTSESGKAYVGRFLPRDDPRVGFFGNYTDCCQHYGGMGNACAVSSVKDPYSQLFVIEDDKGRIIAGSWVWENTEGKYRDVCFDNIEAIGDHASHPVINEIYGKVGKYLAQEANCRHVTIGLGYQDADTSAYAPAKEPIPLPMQYNDGYSDARSQVILVHNPDAKPLDKEKESRRFIRDVCFLDENAMDKVADKCFPESDGRLQQPENLAGKVIVDKDKGVVGYCLWDEQEKSVYDMAVLPEYRKDKNASSTKLFLSVQQEIRKIGGEWTAELRDKTTYHYMKMMQARGLVKMDTLEVDHEMSDGSKVYQVRFTPLEKKRGARQQENAAENNGARSDEASRQEPQGKRFSDVQMATAVRARQGRNAG